MERRLSRSSTRARGRGLRPLELGRAVGHNRWVATTPSLALVGREEELARLEAFVAQLGAGPRALLLRGEPGIGKTALWREAVTAAERGGARVLVTRCAEAEMPIPLGAVSDLVDPAFEDVADSLAEPQRHVLAAALGLETDGRARPDRLALPRALVAALRALAAERPLLLAVDDVQWLDAASVRTLSFALRRVADAPIGVLATLRGDHDAHDPLGLADRLRCRCVRGGRPRAAGYGRAAAPGAGALRRPDPAVAARRGACRVGWQSDVRARVRPGCTA